MTIIQFPTLYHGKQPVSSDLYNLNKKEEEFSMPENLRIDPNDNDLSLEANGVLSKMLNNPDTDYVKAVDLCAVCENDSLRTIKKALAELTDKGYLLRIGNTYAVNKVRITEMKLAWAAETEEMEYVKENKKAQDSTFIGVPCQ